MTNKPKKVKKVTLSNKNKYEKPEKGYIIFSNGVEVKLPDGFCFGERFTITGIYKI